MNKEIVPKEYSMDMKEKYANSNGWKLFARGIQKNPFVKNYILKREASKCAWCNWNINSQYLIHHVDYDHECSLRKTKEYPNPTEKRPTRTIKVPDCEKCSISNPEAFATCMSKITVVHKLCNLKIEEYY